MIADELTRTGKLFQPNELAYLALTGKVELPIRDKLAFNLYGNIHNQGCIVSREWKRCDLAIIKDKRPVALIELKAMYTFNGQQNYLNAVKKMICSDLMKAKELADAPTDIYAILLATHPHEKIATELRGIVKYIGDVNKALDEAENKIRVNCDNAVSNAFSRFKDKVKLGEIEAGECFGTKVSILYWLFGSFKKDDVNFPVGC
jgi:hypothetical protein